MNLIDSLQMHLPIAFTNWSVDTLRSIGDNRIASHFFPLVRLSVNNLNGVKSQIKYGLAQEEKDDVWVR